MTADDCKRCRLLAEAEEMERRQLAAGNLNAVWHWEGVEERILREALKLRPCRDCIDLEDAWAS